MIYHSIRLKTCYYLRHEDIYIPRIDSKPGGIQLRNPAHSAT